MNADKVGIIGHDAMGKTLKEVYDLSFIDVLYNPTYEAVKECTGIFICVPVDDDISILERILKNLHNIGYLGVIISKSTAAPDIYDAWNTQYPNLVYAPEIFLHSQKSEFPISEVTKYHSGVLDTSIVVIGGKVPAYLREAERLIRTTKNKIDKVIYCSISEAVLMKCIFHSFAAVKTVFMNEMQDLCLKSKIDYRIVLSIMVLADSIESSAHQQNFKDSTSINVNRFVLSDTGVGGEYYKHTSALLKYAEQNKTPMNVLDAAMKKNTILRLTESK